ncbi:hypothetical protein HanXRQr2_Chr14g0631721 [Helianthus annuus]|uniref:Uncharacterized protein n=1 Tax=Helianthus annuus TaxID=4232 RepID=A0A251SIA4_HELAN|nr:hypothetical protein HanXRQr2_Chr14g0631721 [Helianthus annuus]
MRWRLGKEAGQTKQEWRKSIIRMQGTPWMPEDDQAQRRTEHDIDTRFHTLPCCESPRVKTIKTLVLTLIHKD